MMPHYAQIETGKGRLVGIVFYSTPPPQTVLDRIQREGHALTGEIENDEARDLAGQTKEWRGHQIPLLRGRMQWELERRPPDDPTPEAER